MNARLKQRLSDAKGYYTLPFSGSSFEGNVIKLDPTSFNLLFQAYSDGDEWGFRERLEKMDEWFTPKPMNIWKGDRWLMLVAKWLNQAKEDKLNRERDDE